jgi:WD40 repeat protein
MKRTSPLPLVLLFLLAGQTGLSGQEKPGTPVLPPRYQPLEKSVLTRLLQVYGSPEVQPSFGQTVAYAGKFAVFASSVPAGDEDTPPSSQLFVWDLAQRSFRTEIPLAGRAVTALALNRDGSQALIGTLSVDAKTKKPAYSLALWDLTQGKVVRSIGTHKSPVLAVAISPDGTRSLTATMGGLAQWDLRDGKALTTFKVPDDKLVAAVAYMPDGQQAISAWGNEVRLWDLPAAKQKQEFKCKNPGVAVLALSVSTDGKRFASADFDTSASLWETDSGKELATWRSNVPAASSATAHLVLTNDSKTVFASWGAVNGGVGIRDSALLCRFDGATGKEAWSKSVPLQGAVPMRLAGKTLVLGGGANPFCEWDVGDGKELRTWGGHKSPITALAATPTGAILSAGSEGVLFLSDGPSGNPVAAWRAHEAAISAIASNKDGKLLTASADKTVKLHDIAKRTSLATLQGHTGNVTCVRFGNGDQWAASGSDDRTVILWDLKEGKKRQVLEGHAEGVNAIALSPSGDWLASASNDNTVRLWPLKDGMLDRDRDSVVLDGHKRQVTCVAFSPDGKLLLSASQDQTIKLWQMAKQEVTRELKGHKNWISAAIFLGPDRVLSASDDLTVRLWSADSAKELDRIDLSTVTDGPRSLVALGPDTFAVGTSGWVVMRFALAK